MTVPRVHVLLVNWNGWADTLECLDTVLRTDYSNYQIIVCDNASTDDSVAHLRAWSGGREAAPQPSEPLRHLCSAPRAEPTPFVELDRDMAERGGTVESRSARVVLIHTGGNLGFAGGNNVGLRYVIATDDAKDSYVCLLNNDTVVSAEWLSRMVAVAVGDPSVGATGAMLWEYHQHDVVESAGGGRVFSWQGMPR
jgi:GT2 family glycosyltransferase